MSFQSTVFEKIRQLFIADSVIRSYVKNKVYKAHPSTIEQVDYPAITLHKLESKPDFHIPDIIMLGVQVDIWLPAKTYKDTDIDVIADRVRALLHRENLNDTDIGITCSDSYEQTSSEMMYDNEIESYHYALIYKMKGAVI